MLDAYGPICDHRVDPGAIYISRNAFMIANAPDPPCSGGAAKGADKIILTQDLRWSARHRSERSCRCSDVDMMVMKTRD
jgi:hypothetical protein